MGPSLGRTVTVSRSVGLENRTFVQAAEGTHTRDHLQGVVLPLTEIRISPGRGTKEQPACVASCLDTTSQPLESLRPPTHPPSHPPSQPSSLLVLPAILPSLLPLRPPTPSSPSLSWVGADLSGPMCGKTKTTNHRGTCQSPRHSLKPFPYSSKLILVSKLSRSYTF